MNHTLRKARVLRRHDLDIKWHETHFGIVIKDNEWGAQIYDPDSPWGTVSQQMWSFVEWFPWQSRNQKIELL